jgi:transcriptional regulator with XRE-family HTH domain
MKLDGTKLKEARLNKGLTQEQVAEKAAVSFATVNRAEHGRGVHPPSAKAIVDVLELKLPDVRISEEEDDDAA